MRRRNFLQLSAASTLAQSAGRPNILWITCEDTGPHLGAYGDRYASTPNLDGLARRGQLYSHCWSNAPVCAPARTALISGMYPASTGSEHMRSMTRLPDRFLKYPNYLREAGYYCSNNSKEDFNLQHTGKVWDDTSNKAHWRNRAAGQPFFSIFNFTITHESQIRRRPHTLSHDPAKVRVPPYHPDTPEVRHDWAQYYDNITTMDGMAGKVLEELKADGLDKDTIVFFYGDHGSGMPRSKRWPYNSGLQVPLIVHVPEKFRQLAPAGYRAGGKSERLVGFVDLAPTLLSLAGIKPPEHMQGRAFAGPHPAPEPEFLHGFRGRMDERYDMVRSVRDKRYVYIRNYMPHQIYGQHIDYMFETPTTRVWKKLYEEGKLDAAQKRFWETKPPEELYDLEIDPYEVTNLAGMPKFEATLERMRKAQQAHAVAIRDVGFLPEDEIHRRSEGSTPYEMGHDDRRYPMERVMAAAELAASMKMAAAPELAKHLRDSDSAVRYWGAMGLLMRGANAVAFARTDLDMALSDASPSVRAVAAHALGRYGTAEESGRAVDILVELADPVKNGVYVSMLAMNALDYLDGKARKVKEKIAALPTVDPKADKRMSGYVKNLVDKTLADLG
ncbi:MAG: sulfatase [Acidimicrobiia bacterium]|nr:sulfatase [Acidimicrobiia bacterium]